MSSQGFSFPPPPPPPPTTQQPAAYPSAQHGQWNGRGAGGRGRGRGNGNRGRGQAHVNSSRPQYPNGAGHNYPPGNYGVSAQTPATPYMPPTPYSHAQSNFHPHNPVIFQSQQSFSQLPTPVSYQPLPGYNGPTNLAHSPYPASATPRYPPNVQTPQHNSPPVNPAMMVSMPWGGDAQTAPGSYGTAPRNHARGPRGNHGPKTRHVNKRDHTAAFNKPKSTAPRCPAPPAVPSFGNPLPVKPPPPVDTVAAQNPKKKRKFNQLGLTPKAEEHESSDEEDVDEEAKLASSAAPLQFTYKGQTATLQSASDITAWIAERRKKFPTQARVDEKQKAAEEAKTAREAARQEKDKQKAKERPSKEVICNTGGDPTVDAAMKAQRKAEKIRRSLGREQKRVAKAEALAEAARLKVEALQKQAQGLPAGEATHPNGKLDSKAESLALSDPQTVALDSTDATKIAELSAGSRLVEHANPVDATADRLENAMDLLSEDGSDWTSSSGSDSDSDSDSEDSAPEEVSSRRKGPERVPPPPREGKKSLCRYFARNGKCNRGDQCNFSHEVAERGNKAKVVEKKGRKGLLDALLDRQKDEEDRRAMEVISWLGQNGLLQATEPVASGSASDIPA